AGTTLAMLGFRTLSETLQNTNTQLEGANTQLGSALYTRGLAVAERELSLRLDVGRAEQLLKDCPEHQRGWEWHHLQRLLDGPVPVLQAHTGGVWSVAFA